MKSLSRRARRIQRNQKLRKSPGLNLVSLMDIFTILVFFLLVNASSDSELPSQKVMKLPDSTAGQPPEETLRVLISREAILVHGQSVAKLEEVTKEGDGVIEPLREELAYRLSLSAGGENDTLTVLADQSVPYEIIRRVVETSRVLEFRQVAFAASQISDPAEEASQL
ncbi:MULTISPECIES: ExbD/TolR family protein [unclassified Marinimicrobium]|jgi:biopolymer transport protein ExbD|uniref:ExbD/TolR family protein n=1 Tax=unclassified Marinimicrobium TaxID=2632100 RepID=UPI00257F6B6D|nr:MULTISPECIES: biopolymer transporter ExbD [unclassified Marinimicrobium]